MKVLVDATALASPYGGGGVGRYVRDLLAGLTQLESSDVDVGVVVSRQVAGAEASLLGGFRVHTYRDSHLPRHSSALAAQASVARAARSGYEILHSPVVSYDFGLPTITLFPGIAQVAVVHDLIPLKMSSDYLTNARRRFWYRTSLRHLRRCARVVAVSGHTAGSLEETGLVAKLDVVPNATPTIPLPRSSKKPREGVLAFSSHGPSKNPTLLDEIARLMSAAGEPLRIIGANEVPEGAISLGKLTEYELGVCYSQARALLVPSLHEGFCYPAVEASSAQVPVLAFDAEWSRWLFPSGENLLSNDAAEWVDTLTGRSLPPSRLRASLIGRTPSDMAADTVQSWIKAKEK